MFTYQRVTPISLWFMVDIWVFSILFFLWFINQRSFQCSLSNATPNDPHDLSLSISGAPDEEEENGFEGGVLSSPGSQ